MLFKIYRMWYTIMSPKGLILGVSSKLCYAQKSCADNMIRQSAGKEGFLWETEKNDRKRRS